MNFIDLLIVFDTIKSPSELLIQLVLKHFLENFWRCLPRSVVIVDQSGVLLADVEPDGSHVGDFLRRDHEREVGGVKTRFVQKLIRECVRDVSGEEMFHIHLQTRSAVMEESPDEFFVHVELHPVWQETLF